MRPGTRRPGPASGRDDFGSDPGTGPHRHGRRGQPFQRPGGRGTDLLCRILEQRGCNGPGVRERRHHRFRIGRRNQGGRDRDGPGWPVGPAGVRRGGPGNPCGRTCGPPDLRPGKRRGCTAALAIRAPRGTDHRDLRAGPGQRRRHVRRRPGGLRRGLCGLVRDPGRSHRGRDRDRLQRRRGHRADPGGLHADAGRSRRRRRIHGGRAAPGNGRDRGRGL